MAVFENSRYVNTSAYVRQGENLIFNIRRRVNFDPQKATYYTVVQGDTIEGISYRQYGIAQLWWAIMDANPRYQHEGEIKPGDLLMIPSFDEVVKACE